MNLAQGNEEPVLLQVDPKCIDSALRGFLQPLKTNNPRADFFAVYRKEAEEFDRDYTKKYDEDLNTTLIFAGLFSAVSSVFIIDVQAKLVPDPNELTAAYMRSLLHALNGSLYPDANPPPEIWPGPDNGVVVDQCLLYASLTTSLFAAFVAMLGKQWLNRFVRNTGKTAAEKSWDRQNKLQGMEQWHFHVVMESLPIMLQLALLLLGCALSSHLWSINHIVASVVIAVTAFGLIFYAFVTVAGSLFYKCPYQTPMSLIVRTVAMRLFPHDPRVTTQPVNRLPRLLARLDKIFRFIKSITRRVPASIHVVEHEAYAMDIVSDTPTPLFDRKLVDWGQHREDSNCVLWTLDASADADVLLFAFRCAADIVWYPEIATPLCSRRLSGLLFDCFLDGEVIPGMEERASHIARILTSILNIHACVGHNLKAVNDIGEAIRALDREHKDPDVYMAWWFLTLASHEDVFECPPLRKDATPVFCIWLSQTVLQSVYWRQGKATNRRYNIACLRQPFEQLLRGRKLPNAVFLNLVLACAVSLGLRLDITELHMSDNSCSTLHTALTKLDERMMVAIVDPTYDEKHIRAILRFLRLWNKSGFQDLAEYCMSWVEASLDSRRPEWDQYQIARDTLLVLDDHPGFSRTDEPPHLPDNTHATVALRYLVLCRRAWGTSHIGSSPPCPAAAIVAFQIIKMEYSAAGPLAPNTHLLGDTLIQTLAWAAERNPNYPAHFRPLVVEIFTLIGGMWFGPWVDNIPRDNRARLIGALGNVLDAPDPHGDHDPSTQLPPARRTGHYEDEMFGGRTGAFVCRSSNIFLIPLLFGLCSSQSWRNSITGSTFSFMSHTSFEPDKWVVWLQHTLKMIASNSRLDITLMVERLKELECYDVLALVIQSIWLSPDPEVLPQRLWEWVEQETVWLLRVRGNQGWAPFGGYLQSISNAYAEPLPGDTSTAPGEAARRVLRYDGQPIGQEPDGELLNLRHHIEVQEPPHWEVHQVRMRRLCQVLECEPELEGLDVLDVLRLFFDGGEAISLTSNRSNTSSFVSLS